VLTQVWAVCGKPPET